MVALPRTIGNAPAESLSSGDLGVCRCDAFCSWNGPGYNAQLQLAVFGFLKWFGARHESLEQVSLLQIDDFLAFPMPGLADLRYPLAGETLANTYYHEGSRSVGDTLIRYSGDIGWKFAGNLLKQYWPNINKKLRLVPQGPIPSTD